MMDVTVSSVDFFKVGTSQGDTKTYFLNWSNGWPNGFAQGPTEVSSIVVDAGAPTGPVTPSSKSPRKRIADVVELQTVGYWGAAEAAFPSEDPVSATTEWQFSGLTGLTKGAGADASPAFVGTSSGWAQSAYGFGSGSTFGLNLKLSAPLTALVSDTGEYINSQGFIDPENGTVHTPYTGTKHFIDWVESCAEGTGTGTGVDARGDATLSSNDFEGIGFDQGVPDAIKEAASRSWSSANRTSNEPTGNLSPGMSFSDNPVIYRLFGVKGTASSSSHLFGEDVDRSVYAIVFDESNVIIALELEEKGTFLTSSSNPDKAVQFSQSGPDGSPDTEFTLVDGEGDRRTFYSPWHPEHPGQMKSATSACGAVVTGEWATVSAGSTYTLTADYTALGLARKDLVVRDIDENGRVTRISLKRDETGDGQSVQTLRTVTYEYNPTGLLTVVRRFDGELSSSASPVGMNLYYWNATDARLAMSLSTDSVLRASAEGQLPSDLLNPTAGQLADLEEYADVLLDYVQVGGEWMVSRQVMQGQGCGCGIPGSGTGEYLYAYEDNPVVYPGGAGTGTSASGATGRNSWVRKVTVSLPHKPNSSRDQEVYFFNQWGQAVGVDKVDTAHGRHAYEWNYYDSRGRRVIAASPDAVNGLDPAMLDLVGFNPESGTAQLLNSTGRVEVTEFFVLDESDPSSGWLKTAPVVVDQSSGLAGRIRATYLQRGDDKSTQVKLSEFEYTDGMVVGDGVVYLASSAQFVDTAGLLQRKTQYTYDFFADRPLQIATKTTILPSIGPDQNGPDIPGSGSSTLEVFDRRGNVIWHRDAAGFITYSDFDLATGALVMQVTDADPDSIASATVAGPERDPSLPQPLELTTVFEVDDRGRTIGSVDPSGRTVYRVFDDTAFDDGWSGERTYQWDDGRPIGPISVQRFSPGLGVSEQLQVLWSVTIVPQDWVESGRPTGAEGVGDPQTRVVSLTRSVANLGRQVTSSDRYFALPPGGYSGLSSAVEGLHFVRTSYKYTGRGDVMEVRSTDGTVERRVYDGFRRLTEVWTGTSAAGATESDPSGGGNTSNNMSPVRYHEYDEGGVGNGNLTKVQTVVDSSTSRFTLNTYDWRGRLVATKVTDTITASAEHSGGQRSLTVFGYDNTGATTDIWRYDGDGVTAALVDQETVAVAGAVLVGHQATSFDDLGQPYLTTLYSVDPATGLTGAALTTSTWRDRRGNVIKTTSPGGLASKYVYDGAGRRTAVYSTDAGGDPAAGTAGNWAAAITLDGDVVLEQSETVYDDSGLAIRMLRRQRHHDATGAGALGDPNSGVRARVSYATAEYDAAGRLVVLRELGNSDTEVGSLATTYSYDLPAPAGPLAGAWATDVTSPGSSGPVTTRTYADLLGRTVRTVENYTSDADSAVTATANRRTDYTYDGAGHVTSMTAWQPFEAGTTPVVSPAQMPNGLVDIRNRDLIVRDSAVLPSILLDTVRFWIKRGLANNTAEGTALATTATSSDVSDPAAYVTLAVVLNDDQGSPLFATFDGVSVGGGDVLVKYTYKGDTNLDGKLDALDLSNILEGFSNALTGWDNGDIDYNGVVNSDDLTAFMSAYNFQQAHPTIEFLTPGLRPQTTEYVYGVSATSGSAITTNNLLAETRYPNPALGVASYKSAGSTTSIGFAHQTESRKYDAEGKVTFATDRNGTVHAYTYDAVGRLTRDTVTVFAAGVDTTVAAMAYGYDSAGRASTFQTLSASNSVLSAVTRTYNGFGQLTLETQTHGSGPSAFADSVAYAYAEGAGGVNHSRLTGMTYGGQTLVYDYGTAGSLNDSISRLTAIRGQGITGGTTTALERYEYLGLGTVVGRLNDELGTVNGQTAGLHLYSVQNSAVTYTGFDRFGRVADQNWTNANGSTQDRFTYGYDDAGNPVYRSNAYGSAQSAYLSQLYTYDKLNRLSSYNEGQLSANGSTVTAANPTVGATSGQGWNLDALGNWKSFSTTVIGAGSTPQTTTDTRTHDAQNRLTSSTALGTQAYDHNGNQLNDGSGTTTVFDAWNRPRQASKGSVTRTYTTDALGRRVSDGASDFTYTSQWQVAVEKPVSGTGNTYRYAWSPVYVDAMIARDTLAAKGTLDEAFGTGGKVTTGIDWNRDVPNILLAQPADGKLVAVASSSVSRPDGHGDWSFTGIRFSSRGVVDTSFGSNGRIYAHFNTSGLDGNIVPSGAVTSLPATTAATMARASSASLAPDGSLIVVGTTRAGSWPNPQDTGIAKFTSAGALDSSFRGAGQLRLDIGGDDSARAVLVLPGTSSTDYKILIAGTSNGDFYVARLNADGTYDTSFGGGDGVAYAGFSAAGHTFAAGALQLVSPTNGTPRIAVAGTKTKTSTNETWVALAEFELDGTLSTAFGDLVSGGPARSGRKTLSLDPANGSVNWLAGISARPGGGLVVGGVDVAGRAALRALTADGSPDTAFGPFGTSYTSASSGLAQAGSNALHTRPDGSFVLVSGTPGTSTWSADAGDDFAVVSFTAAGLPDTAFGAGGIQTAGFGSSVRRHDSVGYSAVAIVAGG